MRKKSDGPEEWLVFFRLVSPPWAGHRVRLTGFKWKRHFYLCALSLLLKYHDKTILSSCEPVISYRRVGVCMIKRPLIIEGKKDWSLLLWEKCFMAIFLFYNYLLLFFLNIENFNYLDQAVFWAREEHFLLHTVLCFFLENDALKKFCFIIF